LYKKTDPGSVSTPPLEISLAFVDDGRIPSFTCIEVQLEQGACIVDIPLTDGLFTINKDQCTDVKSKNVKLNPNVFLKKYGTYDEVTNECTSTSMVAFSGGGTEVHTSCSQPIYVGKRYNVTKSNGVKEELFITAFCNGGKGVSKDCVGPFPPEVICDDSAGDAPSSTLGAGQAGTTTWEDVMKISDFQSVVEESYNASVKSKISTFTSILGVIMTLGWYHRQWN